MEKYLGEWIVHDFSFQKNKPELIYSMTLDYSSSENLLYTTITKYSDNGATDITFSTKGVFLSDPDQIKYPVEDSLNYLERIIQFKSDNLFKGYIYIGGLEFNILVGIKKSPTSVVNMQNLTNWALKEKYINSEQIICSAEIELKLKDNPSINNPHNKTYLFGRYYNYVDTQGGLTSELMNEEFGNGESYELEGEIYENSAALVIKFGDYNISGYSITFDGETGTGVWFNCKDDGTSELIKNEKSQ